MRPHFFVAKSANLNFTKFSYTFKKTVEYFEILKKYIFQVPSRRNIRPIDEAK